MSTDNRLDHLEATLQDHIKLSDANQKKMLGQLSKLIVAVFGEQQEDIDGETYRQGGLVKLATELEHDRINGGVPAQVKWTRGQKIAIAAFVTPSVVTLILALIE